MLKLVKSLDFRILGTSFEFVLETFAVLFRIDLSGVGCQVGQEILKLIRCGGKYPSGSGGGEVKIEHSRGKTGDRIDKQDGKQ